MIRHDKDEGIYYLRCSPEEKEKLATDHRQTGNRSRRDESLAFVDLTWEV